MHKKNKNLIIKILPAIMFSAGFIHGVSAVVSVLLLKETNVDSVGEADPSRVVRVWAGKNSVE